MHPELIILTALSAECDLPPRDLLAGSKRLRATEARMLLVYLLVTDLEWPVKQAAWFVGRDRSTAKHAVETVRRRIDDVAPDADPWWRNTLQATLARLAYERGRAPAGGEVAA